MVLDNATFVATLIAADVLLRLLSTRHFVYGCSLCSLKTLFVKHEPTNGTVNVQLPATLNGGRKRATHIDCALNTVGYTTCTAKRLLSLDSVSITVND